MSAPNQNDYLKPGAVLRMAEGRYVGTGWPKLQGEAALLVIDPAAPWFVMAQFNETEHKYWSHGWHPMPRSSFDGVRVQHAMEEHDQCCRACGVSEAEIQKLGYMDDCKVLALT
jgi:hypothetical protein